MFYKEQSLPKGLIDLIELREKVRNADYLSNDQIAWANNNLTFMIQETIKSYENCNGYSIK
jgi:hypothetical protein